MKHKIFLLVFVSCLVQFVHSQCTNLNSKINNSDVRLPDEIHTGKKAQVSLTVYNNGECDWRNSEVALRVTIARGPSGTTNAEEDKLTTGGDIKMDRTEVDSKSGYGKFIFDIIGPEKPGEYIMQFQLVYKRSKLFGAKVQKDITVINDKLDEKDCKMLSAISAGDVEMPAKVQTGKELDVLVSVKNTGTCDWITQLHKIELKVMYVSFPSSASGERNKLVPGDGYIQATERQVDAGEFADFKYGITGPSVPGTYVLQWQMTNQGTPFGAKFQKQIIVTRDPNDCDTKGNIDVVSFPTTMIYNKQYNVVVRLYNTGKCDWTSATKIEVRCSLVNPPKGNSSSQIDGLLPNGGEFPTGSKIIKPNAEYFEIRYVIKGPYVPGSYKFRWNLYENGRAVSGIEEEKTSIVVIPK